MRTIALMNQKGGVGKTTTTVNLGAALAELGFHVCLIDLDPQAHLTINYGVEPDADTVGLYDVLLEDKSLLEAMHKIDDRIALVPSSIDLAAAEIELVSVIGRESLLRKKLESAKQDFDFVLLDCPPSLGILTINALAAAGEVIIPMQPHFLALQGVGKLLETVQLVSRRLNPKLIVSGIALTMYDSQTKLSAEILKDLQGFIESAHGQKVPWSKAQIFTTKIRRNVKLAESPSFGQHIMKYGPTSNGAMDYRALAKEVAAMDVGEEIVAEPAVAPMAMAADIGKPRPAVAVPPSPPKPAAAPSASTDKTPPMPATPKPATKPVVSPKSPPVTPSAPAAPKQASPQPESKPPAPTPEPRPAVAVTVNPNLKPPKLASPNAVA